MNIYIEILKAIFLGIVEGITEWLPISSTGHMLLVDEFLTLNMSDSFKEMFGENRIIFFDKFNAQSIYEKIKKYYFDIETLDYFAKKAFRHVKKCYAWEKNCMKIMSLYQRVISEYQ